MTIPEKSVISVTKEAVHCDLEDEVVILGLKDGIYYGLNPVGSFIWKLIQKPISVQEIKEAILKEYDVDEETCDNDLQELLGDLLDKGLIELS
jgi:adenine specific DNA methylase Mod